MGALIKTNHKQCETCHSSLPLAFQQPASAEPHFLWFTNTSLSVYLFINLSTTSGTELWKPDRHHVFWLRNGLFRSYVLIVNEMFMAGKILSYWTVGRELPASNPNFQGLEEIDKLSKHTGKGDDVNDVFNQNSHVMQSMLLGLFPMARRQNFL